MMHKMDISDMKGNGDELVGDGHQFLKKEKEING
jgi:hypothetical protein